MIIVDGIGLSDAAGRVLPVPPHGLDQGRPDNELTPEHAAITDDLPAFLGAPPVRVHALSHLRRAGFNRGEQRLRRQLPDAMRVG